MQTVQEQIHAGNEGGSIGLIPLKCETSDFFFSETFIVLIISLWPS